MSKYFVQGKIIKDYYIEGVNSDGSFFTVIEMFDNYIENLSTEEVLDMIAFSVYEKYNYKCDAGADFYDIILNTVSKL